MVMQEEHGIYPGLDRVLRNTLHLVSLWIVLIRDQMSGGQGYRSKASNPSQLQLLYL
jgi:hypothetical protein